jgi:MOSC domain-containing protein YiiM
MPETAGRIASLSVKPQRGWYARVLAEGAVGVGDPVALVD